MKNITLYKWKYFSEEPIYHVPNLKKFSALIATVAVLSSSGVEFDEIVPFVPVSSALEYVELSIVDRKDYDIIHMIGSGDIYENC